MATVTIIYHQEREGWWAESSDAPGFFATGKNRDEVYARVHEYLPRVLGVSPDQIEYREVEMTAGPCLEPVHDREESKLSEGFALGWFGSDVAV